MELKHWTGKIGWRGKGSSNRTKVELKPNIVEPIKHSYGLPIEPKWNWNKYFSVSTKKSFDLPIEPKWNWNIVLGDWQNKRYRLPIEPKWNWNCVPVCFEMCFDWLPIEPKWNWNVDKNSIFLSNPDFQSNQSGIETWESKARWCSKLLPIEPKWNWNAKEVGLEGLSASLPIEPKWNWNVYPGSGVKLGHSLPIEPKWNWNTEDLNKIVFGLGFQSNQSGIETCKTWKNGSCAGSSNRTKVELKHVSNVTFENSTYFQSNQSGIETKKGLEWLHFKNASNRTKVELKHLGKGFTTRPRCSSNRTKVELKLFFGKRISVVWSFQSNQSGIETV